MKQFLDEYFDKYKKAIFDNLSYDQLIECKELLEDVKKKNKKMLIQGNGASAAIASHCALDFTKQAKVRSLSFNEASLITAFVNDYGAEDWVAKAMEAYAHEGDVAVLISSSGSSKNIVNAAKWAKDNGLKVVTFTGFGADNALKQIGDINFWVESKAYNIIESTHMIWLTTIVDMIIGKAEYSVS